MCVRYSVEKGDGWHIYSLVDLSGCVSGTAETVNSGVGPSFPQSHSR